MIHPGELLSAYLDGELTAEEETWVVGHLEQCGACRMDLADVQSARAAVRALPVLDVPGWLRVPPTTRRKQRTPLAAAVAALLALAVGLSALFAPSPEVELPFADIAATHGVRSVQDGITVTGGMAELVTILNVPGVE